MALVVALAAALQQSCSLVAVLSCEARASLRLARCTATLQAVRWEIHRNSNDNPRHLSISFNTATVLFQSDCILGLAAFLAAIDCIEVRLGIAFATKEKGIKFRHV